MKRKILFKRNQFYVILEDLRLNLRSGKKKF